MHYVHQHHYDSTQTQHAITKGMFLKYWFQLLQYRHVKLAACMPHETHMNSFDGCKTFQNKL
jgi:hypothetical protein